MKLKVLMTTIALVTLYGCAESQDMESGSSNAAPAGAENTQEVIESTMSEGTSMADDLMGQAAGMAADATEVVKEEAREVAEKKLKEEAEDLKQKAQQELEELGL